MIEKISFLLANKLVQNTNESNADTDDLKILIYGIECIINTFIPIIFFLVYSLYNHTFFEMLCWFITFISLRNIIGGYHANSHSSCIIFSSIYGLLSLFSLQYISHIVLYIKIVILATFFVIHIIFTPIIHHEEKQSIIYITRTKYYIKIMLLVFATLVTFFHFYMPSISNAIILGMINAEFLFIVEKIKLAF